MKILLAAINAKYIHTNPAVRCLKAYAEKQTGIFVDFSEYTINQRTDCILSDIYRKKPDVLGFSCYIWNMEMVEKLVGSLRLLLPDTLIFLGGPEVSFDADQLLRKLPAADCILCGEGERPFVQLLRQLSAEMPDLSQVEGLCWRAGREIRQNPPGRPVPLEEIPFYYTDLEHLSGRILYYESSRGCPFHCAYCLSSAQRVRMMPLARVYADLQIFLDHRVRQVKFVDRTFNCDRRHAAAVLQYIMEHDNGITNFHCEIEASILQDELIGMVQSARPGLFQFEIGVQTTNPQTLRAVHREENFQKLRCTVQKLQASRGLHLHLDLIAGLPLEDYQSFARSFNDVYGLHPHQLQLGFLKLLKGSVLREQAVQYGIVYRPEPPYEVLFTDALSYDELLRLKGIEEMLEIYHNTGRYSRTDAYLCHAFPTPFSYYEALADFYRASGADQSAMSKEQTYTLLYAFAHEQGLDTETFFADIRYDMMAHEKIRSFPAWMPDDKNAAAVKSVLYRCLEDRVFRSAYLPEYAELDTKQLYRAVQAAVFPFDPVTGHPEETALLFHYRRRDIQGHAAVIRLPFSREADQESREEKPV